MRVQCLRPRREWSGEHKFRYSAIHAPRLSICVRITFLGFLSFLFVCLFLCLMWSRCLMTTKAVFFRLLIARVPFNSPVFLV